MKSKDSSELKQFTANPLWYQIRGYLMVLIGGGIAILCLISPNVHIFGETNSWLPVIGVVVFFLGVFRCVDAFTTETPQGFLVNIQSGVMDIVVGFLVLFSVGDAPENVSLLIVGYMIIQGIYRNIILSVAKVPNPTSNRITGLISIILGICIWSDWPSSATWFLALSLSVDISFRGWALIVLASALKNVKSSGS